MAKGKAKVNYLGRAGLVAAKDAPDWSFLYEASTVKNSHYNVGDRVALPDGRVFRYAKCGATLESMKFFVFSHNQLVSEKSDPDARIGDAAIGDKSLSMTCTAAEIGVNRDGIIAEDELRGGYISIYGSTSGDRPQRGIIGNTALAADGSSFTIYLDAPIKTAITADAQCEILANPYSDVRRESGGYVSALGVPCVKATTGQYFWIQTWGICRVTPDTDAHHGHGNNQRAFYVDQYGVSQQPSTYNAAKINSQYVGFVIERSDSAFGDCAPFVNLQINP